jgi:uncharacterized protein (DUF2267 family)
VAQATLETLGERLFQEAEQLAAQLPEDLAKFLRSHDGYQKYDLEEFISKVGEREGTDTNTAKKHVIAVFRVLSDAVSEGEMEDVVSVLPDEYLELFPRKGETVH